MFAGSKRCEDMNLVEVATMTVITGLFITALLTGEGNETVAAVSYLQWLLSMVMFLALSVERDEHNERITSVYESVGRMSTLLVEQLARIFHDIDAMLKREELSREDALLKVRQELCSVMQMVISEPHRTSFALPQPVDFMLDEFVAQRVQERVAQEMDNV
ncbi:hypothetical protein GUITHDRAFT_118917 [Guillardia theta CCMP2712]|uniref:Uncharacterized protein n=1 Tax=Guillardia theta (strain CCMP2712) TaxID=905079 RepID=L1IFN5_GUITC|nr:hypothetical protein GUITHDRAFT_118917 [Guillardia theta CCMP2712]EKX34877.1 hypothetical protein GUITHDRAFT_118917 [Guillardia theta CCMP2712]|eukprot:XP_005821857.1 hypothetical protein GUITHDRAFT_118917 [Guillardia theta CCMP2712]